MKKRQRVKAQQRRYFRPDITLCPTCGSRLKRCYNLWRKNLILLDGCVRVFSQGYRCENVTCVTASTIYRSTQAEHLHLKRHQVGRDVIVYAGYLRFWHHSTLDQIHHALVEQRYLPISRSEVLNLLADFLSLLRAAQPHKVRSQRERWQRQGGVVIAVDGAQPEKGNECLYLVREVGTGLTLSAEALPESSHGRIRQEVLQPVQQMLAEGGASVRGVGGDAQRSLVMAIEETLPGVPYQSCHFHCLRDAGDLIFRQDRTLKKQLKQAFRDKLQRVEERLRRGREAAGVRAVIGDYCGGLRTLLRVGGCAPYDLGGLRLFDGLSAIAASLARCAEKGGIRCWNGCNGWWSARRSFAFVSSKCGVSASGCSISRRFWPRSLTVPPVGPELPKPSENVWTDICATCCGVWRQRGTKRIKRSRGT